MGKRSRKWHLIFWPTLVLVIAVVLAGLVLLITNLLIIERSKPYIYQSPAEAPSAQCAIVLGARVWVDGTPMDMLGDRLETAVSLYKQGKVEKLLLSGEHFKQPYNQVDVMLAFVLARGIPEEDVFTDAWGLTTYDTMMRARDVFHVQSALIVTQSFHLSRAVYTARQLGLDAVGVVADLQTYRDYAPNAAREVLARVKAILELHILRPEAAGPEESYPLDGDGRITRQ